MRALKAVVFDWAGTLVDHGSRAPVVAFVEAFAQFGIRLTEAEARGPMGLAKRDHIRALLALPSVAAQWQGAADEAAVERVLALFEPATIRAVAHHAAMIAGAVPMVQRIRARGMKVGTTTGYTRPIMQHLLPLAAAQGFHPDSLVCAGDVPEGRPAPLMMYRSFLELGVWPAWAVVKVDDTAVGIAEGLNAGCWTVGVAMSGNACGLTPEDIAALSPDALARVRARATVQLLDAGAHHVIDSVADLDFILDQFESGLARGVRP